MARVRAGSPIAARGRTKCILRSTETSTPLMPFGNDELDWSWRHRSRARRVLLSHHGRVGRVNGKLRTRCVPDECVPPLCASGRAPTSGALLELAERRSHLGQPPSLTRSS